MRPAALLACAALPVLAGCLSVQHVKEQIRAGLVDGALVEGVPFVRQRYNTCAAAALASVMAPAGVTATEEEIAAALGAQEKRGAVTFDVALYARARGLLAVQRYDVTADDLKRSVRAGVPPIVMVGGMQSIIGRYHYAVITGYDDSRGRWIAHWGTKPDVLKRFSLMGFERRRADRWVLFVAGLTDRPQGLPPDVHLEMGLTAEKAGHPDTARFHYAQAAWTPQSAQALVNLGNVELAAGDLPRAEALLRALLALKPDASDARNNLAWVLLQRGERLDEAEKLAREAAQDPKVRKYALDTLAAILEKQGKTKEAAEVRRQAETIHPKASLRTRQ